MVKMSSGVAFTWPWTEGPGEGELGNHDDSLTASGSGPGLSLAVTSGWCLHLLERDGFERMNQPVLDPPQVPSRNV